MTYAVASRDTPAGGAAPGAGDASLDIWTLVRRIWARKWFLILFVGACMVLAYAALTVVTPRYTGEVRVLIEGQTPDPTNPLGNQMVRAADQQKIESEIQVLLSRSLADEVISTLKLGDWDEFSRPSGGLFGFGASTSRTKTDVMDAYYQRLNVYQIGTSRVIAIDVWAEHPRSATIIANAIANIYVADQLDAQVSVTRRASSWLDQQVDKLREQVRASEDAVSEYRRENGLIESNGTTLKSTELSELNTQLILARAAKSEAQARLDSARSLLTSPNGIETSSEVLDSNLIQQLREQEVALQRQITELSADLLPQHPDMIARQAELDDLRNAISAEVAKIVRRLENEVRVAAAREVSLQRSISRLKTDVTKERQREGQLRALEREAVANRQLLESFLLRASETGARDDRLIQRPEARIISRAETPQSPSFPQKGPVLMLAFMASLTLGLLIVLAVEMLSPVSDPVRSGRSGRGPSLQPQGRSRQPGYDAGPAPFQPAPAFHQAQPAYQPGPAHPSAAMSPYGVPSYPVSFEQPQGQAAGMTPPPAPPPHTGGVHAMQPPGGAYAAAPVMQSVARLPAGNRLTPHEQWLMAEGCRQIQAFIGAQRASYGGGHVVRVSPGATGASGLVGIARLMAQQGHRVMVIGCAPQRGPGFTDMVCGRASLPQVMQADAHSAVRFIDWGSIPLHDDPGLIRAALGGLARQASLTLVADVDTVVFGLDATIDRACDTALILRQPQDRSPMPVVRTATAGVVQVG